MKALLIAFLHIVYFKTLPEAFPTFCSRNPTVRESTHIPIGYGIVDIDFFYLLFLDEYSKKKQGCLSIKNTP